MPGTHDKMSSALYIVCSVVVVRQPRRQLGYLVTVRGGLVKAGRLTTAHGNFELGRRPLSITAALCQLFDT